MNHARQRDRQIVREMARAKLRKAYAPVGPDMVTQDMIRSARYYPDPYAQHAAYLSNDQPLPIVQPTALQRSVGRLRGLTLHKRVEYVRDLYERGLLRSDEAYALVFGNK